MQTHLLLSVSLLLAVSCFGPVSRAEEGAVIVQEENCLSAGGICVHESKCPTDKLNRDVECSKQKDLGAVCCHSAHPPDETMCEKLAGECKAECADNLKVAQARNCPPDQVCCTLV